jgi:hypothetical protein
VERATVAVARSLSMPSGFCRGIAEAVLRAAGGRDV